MSSVVEPRAVVMEELKSIHTELKKINDRLDQYDKLFEVASNLGTQLGPLMESLKDNPLVSMFLGGMGNPFVASDGDNNITPPINVLSFGG